MTAIQIIVWILLAGLIAVSIAAVVKLMSVLNEVSKTLDTTRRDIDKTIHNVDAMVAKTNVLLDEEVTPTLRMARQAVQNVEITSRAAADTVVAARSAMERIDSVVQNSKVAAAGGALAKMALQKGAGSTSSLMSRAASGASRALFAILKSRISHPRTSEHNGAVSKPVGVRKPAGVR